MLNIIILIICILLSSCGNQNHVQSTNQDSKTTPIPMRITDIPQHQKNTTEEINWEYLRDNFSDSDISLIGAIKEKNIYLYSFPNIDGFVLYVNDDSYIFDSWNMTPRMVFPQMAVFDCNGDNIEELIINRYFGSFKADCRYTGENIVLENIIVEWDE